MESLINAVANLALGGLAIVTWALASAVSAGAAGGLGWLGHRWWQRGGSFYRGAAVVAFALMVPPALVAIYLLFPVVCLSPY